MLPVNFEKLASEKIEHKWLTNKKYKTILTVGRLHFQKNHQLLIDAFFEVRKKRDDLRLVLLGEGIEEENIIRKIKNLNIEDYVDIIPFQQNPYPFYKNADVFVLSSLWEGFGNVLVEALACGTKVVSTDCPGGPRIILNHGKYGKLVPENNASKMAEAILDVLTQDNRVVELGIEQANKFSIDNIGKQYLDVL